MNYSKDRKESQVRGDTPEWYITPGYQLIKDKNYINEGETVRDRYMTIAETLSKHMPSHLQEKFKQKFFNLQWSGMFSNSTPLFSNTGKGRALPISCSGSYCVDSVSGFYKVAHEIAMLSKNGFGTSVYLGNIRPAGSIITGGGVSDGVVPVIELMRNTATHINQDGKRRGSVAVYLELDHGDFWDVITFVKNNPKNTNIGWLITDEIEAKLDAGDEEMDLRYQEMLNIRMRGKGYIVHIDKANRLSPEVYKKYGVKIRASNLCSEIMLHSSELMSFTCCLGSINVAKWGMIEALGYEPIFDAIVMLDCVNSEFIDQGRSIEGVDKAVRFAEWSRPVGLGQMGMSTYFQENDIVYDGLDGFFKAGEISRIIKEKSHEANLWLGELLGESPLMKGTGLRMSHTNAIAPTMSSALIMGGVSNAIEPFFLNAFIQETAGGDVTRINPVAIKMMKEKGIYDEVHIDKLIADEGSFRNFDEFTEREKQVMKTAFEVNKDAHIRLVNEVSKYNDQGVSFNLFIAPGTPEELVAKWHYDIIKSDSIKSAYYVRSASGITARTEECVACE